MTSPSAYFANMTTPMTDFRNTTMPFKSPPSPSTTAIPPLPIKLLETIGSDSFKVIPYVPNATFFLFSITFIISWVVLMLKFARWASTRLKSLVDRKQGQEDMIVRVRYMGGGDQWTSFETIALIAMFVVMVYSMSALVLELQFRTKGAAMSWVEMSLVRAAVAILIFSTILAGIVMVVAAIVGLVAGSVKRMWSKGKSEIIDCGEKCGFLEECESEVESEVDDV